MLRHVMLVTVSVDAMITHILKMILKAPPHYIESNLTLITKVSFNEHCYKYHN